jgi:hypothetical protein
MAMTIGLIGAGHAKAARYTRLTTFGSLPASVMTPPPCEWAYGDLGDEQR